MLLAFLLAAALQQSPAALPAACAGARSTPQPVDVAPDADVRALARFDGGRKSGGRAGKGGAISGRICGLGLDSIGSVANVRRRPTPW
jgi:hypothetical protein